MHVEQAVDPRPYLKADCRDASDHVWQALQDGGYRNG